MSKICFMSLAGVFVLGSVSFGQQYEATDAHAVLKKEHGKWDAAIKMWLGEGEPQKFKGEEENKPVGELWTVSAFKGDFFGQQFVGHGTFGYDPEKKKYVGVWIDSSKPYADHMEGDYDAASKTLTMLTKGKDPTGATTAGKNVTVMKDKNTRIFTMYMKQGEKYIKSMEITYTRAKAK